MKQTNPSSALRVTVSLGILGLNEGFVQMNEVMTIVVKISLDVFLCIHFAALSMSYPVVTLVVNIHSLISSLLKYSLLPFL